MQTTAFYKLLLFTITSFVIVACNKNNDITSQEQTNAQREAETLARVAATVKTFYSLTHDNQLILYKVENQIKETGSMAISGLMSAEMVLAIDFRPATGQLYGVTNQNRLYIIDLNTGKANMIGTAPFSTDNLGDKIGFDFNPTVDRIRLVSATGKNLRLHPELGTLVATDGNISDTNAEIVASAYTNNMAGATTTTLFNIDAKTDKLYKQDPPNNGTINAVGSLGVNVVGEAGFDIAAESNMGLAVIFGRGLDDNQKEESNGNKYRFYTIDINTGMASNIGKTDRILTDIAIPTSFVSYAVDEANNLVIMHPTSALSLSKPITGLEAGVNLVGIDLRPATAQLYALGSNSKLYTINMATGAATAVGMAPFSTLLNGTNFGIDFNPTVDRLRIVSNTGQNLRVNPITGAIAAVDMPLSPSNVMVDAAAYTNNFVGTSTTELLVIDTMADVLYLQNPPNNGILTNPKPLGIDITAHNGFDIGGQSNKAWGIFKTGSMQALYSINLTTGQTTAIMAVNGNFKGFAVGLGF